MYFEQVHKETLSEARVHLEIETWSRIELSDYMPEGGLPAIIRKRRTRIAALEEVSKSFFPPLTL